MTGNGNTGGRLQRDVGNDLLTAADAAKNAAGVVALESGFGDLIAVFAAAQLHHLETVANLHAFHGVDAHQRMGDIGVKAVKDRLAKARRYAVGDDGNFGANGVALFFQTAHQFIESVDFLRIRAEEGILFNLFPVLNGQRNVAHLRQATANDDAELRGEEFFGNRPGRHAHRGFAGGGATAATIVA